MRDIKTKERSIGPVKTLDRMAGLSSRMKAASVRTKESFDTGCEKNPKDASGYASDEIVLAAEFAGRQAQKRSAASLGEIRRRRNASYQKFDIERHEERTEIIKNHSGRKIEADGSDTGYRAKRMQKSVGRSGNYTGQGYRSVENASSAPKIRNHMQITFTKKENERIAKGAANNAREKAVKGTKESVKGALRAARAAADSARTLFAAIYAGGSIAIIVILICTMFGASFYFFGDESSSNYTPVSQEVEAYTPLIRKYAVQYSIPEYVDLINAVMMQESGGAGTDPMQCSESPYNTSYEKKPNSIQDPEYSIDCGVHYLADCLNAAGSENPLDMEHIRLALQGYNYGNGYIPWAIARDGGYTVENAAAFSDEQAVKHGWSGYGDKHYVSHVLRYYPYGNYNYGIGNTVITEVAAQEIGNIGGEKYWRWYGFSGHVAWCACFVSWCADQCGYIDAGILPRFSVVDDGITWFKDHNQWQGRGYVPAPGDIIFFDWCFLQELIPKSCIQKWRKLHLHFGESCRLSGSVAKALHRQPCRHIPDLVSAL